MYDVWKNVLADIEQKISKDKFTVWFRDTSLISSENGNIIIGTKSAFVSKMLSTKFLKYIEDALKNTDLEVKNISFEVTTTISNKTKVHPREVTTPTPTKINDIKKPTIELRQSNGLNSKYTIDSFIVGSNNDVAAAAAKSIIDAPGTRYNPFFLYGGPGLGKTHLIQAIGNALVQKDPNLKVLYISTNEFYSDFIKAVRNGKGEEFYKKYQKLDCLILDDFQSIIGKEKSQEEFFNIFNSLYQLNKQIIVTSDRLPSQIETLDARLSSRLTMGGAFDIQLPKFEDRCAILRAKADLQGAEIEDEAIEYIAENINTNIRDLERELSTILITAEVRGVTPLELINSGSTIINKSNFSHQITAKQIMDKVAKEYNISTKEMCSKSRVSNIKTARQISMYLMIKELSMSLNQVAKELGMKDHTTIMNGRDKIESELKLNFALRDKIESIKEKLYA